MAQTNSEKLFKAAKSNRITAQDAELAGEFIEYYSTTETLSKGSRNKYYYSLLFFLEQIKKRQTTVAGLNEKDVLFLKQYLGVATIKHRHATDLDKLLSEDTKRDYWLRFCKFYGWAHERYGEGWDKQAYALLAGKKKTRYKVDKNRIERKGILSPEEVLQLVHAEDELCYKVFFAVLYESGTRSGEALSLRIRDVTKEQNGTYTLNLRKSKTIKRPVPLIQFSTKYLRQWLQRHPDKNNKDAPLFVNVLGTGLNNEGANKHLRDLLKKVGIKREKISLHSFRHSRATELAGIMNEFQMCRFFGWSMGSAMPATYIREQAIDVRGALMAGYGLQKQERTKEVVGVACLQCEHRNPSEAQHCDNCNLPLDPKHLQEMRRGAQELQGRELAKKYALELRQSIIQEVLAELRNEKQSNHSSKDVIQA